MTNEQTNFINEIVKTTKNKKISLALFYNSEPCHYIRTIYKKGELKETWFSKIFGFHLPFYKKKYECDYLKNIYTNQIISVDDFIGNKKNIKFIYKENEKYPIWYANGISLYFKNSYGNLDTNNSFYFIGNMFSDTEIQEMVYYINEQKLSSVKE